MTKVLITGGSGLIGRQLSKRLKERHYKVVILTRNPKRENEFLWNIDKEYIDGAVFRNVEYIVHLAGAGIADRRWTKKRKQEIIDSRVKSTNLLLKKIKECKMLPRLFIAASAIGIYGGRISEVIYKEIDSPANDFLGNVCRLWEESVLEFEKENITTVMLRTGVVLAKKGGALVKMKTPVINPLGSGNQYISWIHIDDLCSIYIMSIENNLSGVFNAVAPEHQTNYSFSKALAQRLRRLFIPIGIPSFILKIIFGEMAIILLKGSRVSCEKILQKGFVFQFPTLKKALKKL